MAASLGQTAVPEGRGPLPRQRICRQLPRHLALASDQRCARTLCRGLALPDVLHWPVREWLARLLPSRGEAILERDLASRLPEITEVHRDQPLAAGRHQLPRQQLIVNATALALQAGLRLTGIALRLAKMVVEDMQRSLRSWRSHKSSSNDRANELVREAQAQLLQEAQRRMLDEQGKDAAFMQMLHNLDRCHIDHDEKWALFTKLSADKAEFSKRWQHLYKLAQESKASVDTLLRPDATRKEINSFWRSPQTTAIIAEEDALKQLVFAQVYQAGAA